jgi:GNAT superfamily N-acetyltransferase
MTTAPTSRLLVSGDEAALEAFLHAHADSSMFLRSNLRAAGLVDHGQPLQGTYAADVDDQGRVSAVVGHFWNGNLLAQAEPARAAVLAKKAARATGRAVAGFVGPWAQVVAMREALGFATAEATLASREALFALDLVALRLPAPLAEGKLVARVPGPADMPLVADWRVDYCVEALGATRGHDLARDAARDVEHLRLSHDSWLLLDGATPVAYTAFNARLPDVVQVGGVWTPPALRGRGFARAVVAASLRDARAAGVTRAILFTGDDNVAAQHAYRSIGFQVVGEYGLVLLREPRAPSDSVP